jgi:hypothetical protein
MCEPLAKFKPSLISSSDHNSRSRSKSKSETNYPGYSKLHRKRIAYRSALMRVERDRLAIPVQSLTILRLFFHHVRILAHSIHVWVHLVL